VERNRLFAPPVREEVPDFEPILSPSFRYPCADLPFVIKGEGGQSIAEWWEKRMLF